MTSSPAIETDSNAEMGLRVGRVGVDLAPLHSRLTGIGNYESHLLRELMRRPDAPQLVGFGRRNWRSLDRKAFQVGGAIDADAASWPSRLRAIVAGSPMIHSAAYAAHRQLRRVCYQASIKLQDISLFHAFAYLPPGDAAVPVIPVVYDVSFVRYPETHPRVRLRALDRLGQYLQKAPVVHTISQFSAREISDVYGISSSRIRVIYPGVGSAFQSRMRPSEGALAQLELKPQSFFLVVSTLEPRKNFRTLVEAYAALSPALRLKYPLCVVGAKGWGSLDLPPQWDELTREGSLRFLGYVPNSTLAELYASTSAFFYPSLYEGFGMPIIEAMSCGAPVVCSDAASMPEAGGEIAAKIAPLDVGGWTEKFREFAQSEQESSDHAKRREIHLRKFTWSAAADQTFEMYKEVG